VPKDDGRPLLLERRHELNVKLSEYKRWETQDTLDFRRLTEGILRVIAISRIRCCL
jgi:hypothetical protein